MIDLRLGDCRTLLPTIPSGSVDAVISDPIYPEVDRSYGRISEAEWHDLMRVVVAECRRILKPSGSAVFILQPNSERVGRMRPWLWEFMAWTAKEWNQVQDAWWWNIAALPVGGCNTAGLLRPSLKACVWLGAADCYRNQEVVLWDESLRNAQFRASDRFEGRRIYPSGRTTSVAIYDAAMRRGGVTPFNVLPIPNTNSTDSSATFGHGAGTPEALCDWWVRYISPPLGVVLDPFAGLCTVGRAAIRHGRSFIGFEKDAESVEQARVRLDGPPTPLFDGIADLPVADETPLFSGATS
jgi:DNA modification methylase